MEEQAEGMNLPLAKGVFPAVDDELLRLHPSIVHRDWLVGSIIPLGRVIVEKVVRVVAFGHPFRNQLCERASSEGCVETRLRLRCCSRAN